MDPTATETAVPVTLDTVVIGARGSKLAQIMVAEFLAGLGGSCPVVRFRNRVVLTNGDKDRVSPMSAVGGASGGAFTSQLEVELREGRIDVAVHSLKDLPTEPPDGLALATTPGPRADPREALIGAPLGALRYGARVGTGSTRRIAQLRAVRPDLQVVPLRGNVPSRVAKLRSAGLDAVMLAAAGLLRLGLADRIAEYLPLDQFPPSPGQGAMGIQVRAADRELLTMLSSYGDPAADRAVRAERALLGALHGGCSVPVGAYAEVTGPGLTLTGQVTSLDGRRQLTATAAGEDPEQLGADLAATLLGQGAGQILAEIRTPAGQD
ncbi:MAG TPA: hydroxymethylbilane synthase [Streptosporangiaceae bacterium]|jgi:hydroxymethylbilane synthase|nr:hydroxymethylbilane synthase [Streptosporangiaceae bacterium]